MGLYSFAGRVFFSAIFILQAYQKFNDYSRDAKLVQPKIVALEESLGVRIPEFDLKYLILGAMVVEGLGSLLFIIGSRIGAYLLLTFLACVTPLMHDFYNLDAKSPEYMSECIQFLKNMAMFGALLFFLSMKRSQSRKAKSGKIKSL